MRTFHLGFSIRQIFRFLFFSCLVCSSPAWSAPDKAERDVAFVRQFVSGKYILVGRKPDSEATYTGRVTFRENHGALEFTRTMQGRSQHGAVVLDTKTAENGKPVLRMQFRIDGHTYEAIYLWHSDLSNYARLTGYVYSPAPAKTKSPGLEALFPIDGMR
jgi:hypothetical protein